MSAYEWICCNGVVCLLMLLVLAIRSTSSIVLPIKNTDVKACNTTSSGHIYTDGSYAPMLLHSTELPLRTSSYCFYRFLGTPRQRVWLQIQQLLTGYYDFTSRSCRDGLLRIYDGSSEPGNHLYHPFTFCGHYNNMNATVFTSGHVGVVELHSQSETVSAFVVVAFKYVNMDKDAKTFPKQIFHSMRLAPSTAYMCAWKITIEDCDDECPILSPGYPGSYPPNAECGYDVNSKDTNAALQIKFSGMNTSNKPREFDIKATEDCREEYLELYDGDSAASPKIGKFCGNAMPDVTSSGSHLYIVFASGPDTPSFGNIGFHASVLGLTKEWHGGGMKLSNRLCDWSFNVTEGSISTPDHWLPKNNKCTYSFHILTGHRLNVILNLYGLR